jgi:hypothetical protein
MDQVIKEQNYNLYKSKTLNFISEVITLQLKDSMIWRKKLVYFQRLHKSLLVAVQQADWQLIIGLIISHKELRMEKFISLLTAEYFMTHTT